MGSASKITDAGHAPIVFGLDADFNICEIDTVGPLGGSPLSIHFRRKSFLSLVPPEARGAADDFFTSLLPDKSNSTSQLFLKLAGQRPVPIDLICRRVDGQGEKIWEAVVWDREKYNRTERELMLLYAVSSRINQANDDSSFAEEVLFQIHNMMDVDASVMLNLLHGRLQLTAARGLCEESLRHLKTLPNWQVDLYLPVESVDPAASMPAGAMELARKICAASGCGPWLVIPMRTASQLYGIVGVARRSAEPFSERERYLLMALGRNLANACEKGRLFRRIKERNHNLARSRRELRGSLERLERAHRELQHLDEMKKSFVTLASHELQTPLTTIIGNAELLGKDLERLPARARLSLAGMLEGVDDLRARVESLLAANRVGSGFFAPRFERCTTQQIFAELEPEFVGVAEDCALTIRRCGRDDCPDILLDVELVKQALRLQLDNAIRHTPPGGEIVLSCSELSREELLSQTERLSTFYPDAADRIARFGEWVMLIVEDSGEGIEEREKAKIFSPFYTGTVDQHHSSRGFNYTGKGFGLGLSLARRIIEAHNGMLWVEDRPGGGSRFCQLLPLPG